MPQEWQEPQRNPQVLTLGTPWALSGVAALGCSWPRFPSWRVQPWGRQAVPSWFSQAAEPSPARGDSGRLGWAAWGSRALPTAPAKGPAGAIPAGTGTGTGQPEGTVQGHLLQATPSTRGPHFSSSNSNFPPKSSVIPRGITWKQHSATSKTHLAHTGSVCFEKNCKTSKQNVKRAALICKLGAEEELSHKKGQLFAYKVLASLFFLALTPLELF